MAGSSDDRLGLCEGFAVDGYAAACGVPREQILLPLLRMRSLLRRNRSLFEVLRDRIMNGTRPTDRETFSALIQAVGATIGVEANSFTPALASGIVAALGLSAGMVPLVTIGIVAIAAYLIWWPVSNVLAFIADFLRFLRESLGAAAS